MTRPRILLIVIGLPETLRIAVAPNATMIVGSNDLALVVEPPVAAIDLVGIRALVQPPFATRFEFEVFHRIGDENQFAVNFGVLKSLHKHAAGRTNKWFPCLSS